MITSVLNGGLGNTLFQVAASYGVAIDNGDRCAFYLDNPVVMQGHPAYTYKDTVYSKLVVLDREFKAQSHCVEMAKNYEKIKYKENLALHGYWQSEKYFEGNGEYIACLFRHTPTIKKLLHEFAPVLKNSVSIHIRRGDYVDVGEAMELDYYYECLDRLREERTIDNILIFSDDQDWCRENFLRLSVKTRFLSGNKDYEDLYLMSLCSNNITGNSSFSWWGAYLNTNPDKLVYMPKPWTSSHSNDIYPDGVIIIPR